MITDKMLKAAMEVLKSYDRFVSMDTLRAALEAAEAAAWSEDIGQAPRDGTPILIEAKMIPDVFYVATNPFDGGCWDAANDHWYDIDIKRWRHLPQPQKDNAS